MSGPNILRDGHAMIAGMTPVLDGETYAFCSATNGALAAEALPLATGMFREAEGISLILTAGDAERLGFTIDQPMARITLNVYSALDGVGLTAAVASALAEAGIACNMIAAFHHDHVFVPLAHAEEALAILEALQRTAPPSAT